MRTRDKIKMVISSILLTVKFFALSLFSRRKIVDGNERFIVSLTSYGKRVNYVFLTLESILHQNRVRPMRVILWLYKKDKPSGFSKYIINKQISRGVEVIYLEDDYKSFKKLSYILNVAENCPYVVTADDDILYPGNWLQGFNDCINQDPDSIYCYRARLINFTNTDEVASYNSWQVVNEKRSHNNLLIPTGVSGVCYPIKYLDKRLEDFHSISSLCPYADDIWYKLLTTSNGCVSRLVFTSSIHFTPVITGFSKGLEMINVKTDYNTQQFNNALTYFNLKKSDFM
ncbi:hypothetical protein [Pantoea sp. GM01]|uniref:hypothetical protein n=1 Tax=Pantoea sp. GM01 TaxID=1144320 RepID=UPI000271435A|nr:hypothetical protein [Pantoea sp. GM01]EJL89598.1 hypothetical protein PMI17_02082 [Pantoea sp. GM01]